MVQFGVSQMVDDQGIANLSPHRKGIFSRTTQVVSSERTRGSGVRWIESGPLKASSWICVERHSSILNMGSKEWGLSTATGM